MRTPLVCHAHAPGTPDNPLDVYDFITAEGEIRLVIRREGKLFLNLKFPDDAEGREAAEAMWADMTRQCREPSEEDWRSVPDLMAPVDTADPADAQLCIQWDIDGRAPEAALALRNEVLEQAESLLDEAGLLIDWAGASIGSGTVETTFEVSDFDAAKAMLWTALSPAQKAHNCRIFDETAA